LARADPLPLSEATVRSRPWPYWLGERPMILLKALANARKTPPSAAEDAELKASVKARGLKQNLVVCPSPEGQRLYAVAAGGQPRAARRDKAPAAPPATAAAPRCAGSRRLGDQRPQADRQCRGGASQRRCINREAVLGHQPAPSTSAGFSGGPSTRCARPGLL